MEEMLSWTLKCHLKLETIDKYNKIVDLEPWAGSVVGVELAELEIIEYIER